MRIRTLFFFSKIFLYFFMVWGAYMSCYREKDTNIAFAQDVIDEYKVIMVNHIQILMDTCLKRSAFPLLWNICCKLFHIHLLVSMFELAGALCQAMTWTLIFFFLVWFLSDLRGCEGKRWMFLRRYAYLMTVLVIALFSYCGYTVLLHR